MNFEFLAPAHPYIVHFPVALLMVSCVLYLAAFMTRRPGLSEVAFWTLVLGSRI